MLGHLAIERSSHLRTFLGKLFNKYVVLLEKLLPLHELLAYYSEAVVVNAPFNNGTPFTRSMDVSPSNVLRIDRKYEPITDTILRSKIELSRIYRY